MIRKLALIASLPLLLAAGDAPGRRLTTAEVIITQEIVDCPPAAALRISDDWSYSLSCVVEPMPANAALRRLNNCAITAVRPDPAFKSDQAAICIGRRLRLKPATAIGPVSFSVTKQGYTVRLN